MNTPSTLRQSLPTGQAGSGQAPLRTGKTITITRVFDAPRGTVWNAWTVPSEAKKWWGPKDFTAPHTNIDLKVGGNYLFAMHGPAGSEFDKDLWSGGTYKEIVPMEKLMMTDHFADEKGNKVSPAEYGMLGDWPEEMVVTVTFEDAGEGKTKMTLKHEGHPADIADQAEQGWNQSLDKLAASL